MFEIGWSEMLVVAVVALIVVGPKDLPRMMRAFGQWTGRLRNLAGQFQRSMDDAARELDVQELRDAKDAVNNLRSIQNPFEAAMKGVNDRLAGLDRPRPAAAPPAPEAAARLAEASRSADEMLAEAAAEQAAAKPAAGAGSPS